MRAYILFALVGLLLCGCATGQYRVPVSAQTKQLLRSSEVIIVLHQDEIIADYAPVTTAAVSGVIAGLPGIGVLAAAIAGGVEGGINAKINSDRAEEAKQQAAPVRAALRGYDFKAALKDALNSEFGHFPWLKVADIDVRRESDDTPLKPEELLAQTRAGALLLIRTRYSLSAGMKGVRIVSDVALLPKSGELKTVADRGASTVGTTPLYRNQLTYTSPLPGTYRNVETAAGVWSGDQARLVRAALGEGAVEIGHMIALDLDASGVTAASATARVQHEGISAAVVEQSERRMILRLDNGRLMSVARPGSDGGTRLPVVAKLAPAPGQEKRETDVKFPRVLNGAEIAAHFSRNTSIEAKASGFEITLAVGPGSSFSYICPICFQQLVSGEMTIKTDESSVCFRLPKSNFFNPGCYQLIQTGADRFELRGGIKQDVVSYSLRR